MTAILGVDPGKRAGWALWQSGSLQGHGIIDGDDPGLVLGILSYWKPGVVVIEDQYFRKGKLKGIKTLLRRRYTWEILAKSMGIDVEIVNPNQWQNGYEGIRRGNKQDIRHMAKLMTGIDPGYDAADAVLIARWWELEIEWRERINA